MYATAQRVFARRADVDAINSCLYLHGDEAIDWSRPDIRQIAGETPGRPTLVVDELPPGGNEVLSYLDVAAPDAVRPDVVVGALDAFEGRLIDQRGEIEALVGTVALRFWCAQPLEANRIAEFTALRGRVVALVTDPALTPIPGRQSSPPLVVEVQRDDRGTQYVLASTSAEAVRELHRGPWRRPRIRIGDDVRGAFEALHGSFHAHLPRLLTGLTDPELNRFSSVRFVDRATGRVLATWPEDETLRERA